MKVWDAATGQETLTLKGHTGGVDERGVQPRRQAARLRQSGWDGEGVGRRDRAGNPHPQGAHAAVSTSVAFSPDGKRIASASQDRTVKVWDARTGQETLTLKGHTDVVSGSVAFSPDGKRLASASEDGTVKVWDAGTGQEILTLKGHTGACHERGVQPRRQAARLRQSGWDGEGVGRPAVGRRTSETRSNPTVREPRGPPSGLRPRLASDHSRMGRGPVSGGPRRLL